MKRALLSVSNRTGLVSFAKGLQAAGFEVLATGSTKVYLEAEGVQDLLAVESITGFPEMLDGRVKTLHPAIHGGILAVRDNPVHLQQITDHGIALIDVVCVNLYPFKETIAKADCTFAEAIENIDIGGPTLLRSAAKNHHDVTVVIDPSDYARILEAYQQQGDTSLALRQHLAAKVFAHTAHYDSMITTYFNALIEAPVVTPLTLGYDLKQTLRYGENPHQQASFYQSAFPVAYSMSSALQRHGKALSYNNIQDGDAALALLAEFKGRTACVALKHTNPCGVALAETVDAAFERAYEADPISIFGGIIAFNQPVTLEAATKMNDMFLEIILAPAFTPEAFAVLSKKKNIRLMTFLEESPESEAIQFRSVNGGLLVQEKDTRVSDDEQFKCVTKAVPDAKDWEDMKFAEIIVKHLKSNAIVLVKDLQTIGVGAGQLNRVGAARIAIEQAGAKAKGSIMGSDAFFPMSDTVEAAAAAGVRVIVQPGGSLKDQLSIDACDQAKLAMVVTGERHFKH